MTLEEYFRDWIKVIDLRELNNIMNKLNILYSTKIICPDKNDVFRAFSLCSLKDLKVVMIGLDPYPQKGVATGILFGNRNDLNLSPSLQIIKDAAIDLEVSKNSCIFDPTLEEWEKQGILMINSALTVECNKTGSHTMLWRPFISSLLSNLSNYSTGIIYVLFGEIAQTFEPYINRKYNIILKEKHPAYYARINKDMPSTIFKEISRLTKEKYGNPIQWYKEY